MDRGAGGTGEEVASWRWRGILFVFVSACEPSEDFTPSTIRRIVNRHTNWGPINGHDYDNSAAPQQVLRQVSFRSARGREKTRPLSDHHHDSQPERGASACQMRRFCLDSAEVAPASGH